jgi:hypothetical protein
MKAVARPFLPAPPPGAPSQPALWKPGALEAIAAEAGLTPDDAFDISWAYEYSDEETLVREMLAVAGLAVLVAPAREPAVAAEIAQALAPFRDAEGRYRFENELHFLVARA